MGKKTLGHNTTKEEKCAKVGSGKYIRVPQNERIVWDKIIQKASWKRWDMYYEIEK